MFVCHRLVLAALLLTANTALLEPASATSRKPPAPVAAPGRLVVAQTHGYATKPKQPAGYRVSVRGAPGTLYEVNTTAAGGVPQLLTSGTIPAGGSITVAMMVPGAPAAPHTEKVLVSSTATARIVAIVEYY